ncbi:unnamed protein product [Periconia digitata]|uniref:Uncharacterized protein n=1 Tax=Periconia digitata TaxID=1303443 RepID=A0A9W4UDV8_9PLEO|nr:unnamed protein product [Periconia digitata]
MPPPPSKPPQPCPHKTLQLTPSPFAPLAGYTQPSSPECLAAQHYTPSSTAARSRNKRKRDPTAQPPQKPQSKIEIDKEPTTFPAPLVLPYDQLNYDPDEEPQSLTEWVEGEHRNVVTKERNVVYVVGYPEIGEELKGIGMNEWAKPQVAGTNKGEEGKEEVEQPDIEEIVEYLQAFYHGLRVQRLDTQLTYLPWTTNARGKKTPSRTKPKTSSSSSSSTTPHTVPKYISLHHPRTKTSTRIRVRPSPSIPPSPPFPVQLNLNDLLDGLLAILPSDAYAILLLVKQDIYESPEDDFCCGRAYGGSRIAVVQTARYHPSLHPSGNEHVWPMSHCKAFVNAICEGEEKGLGSKPASKKEMEMSRDEGGGVRRAISAAMAGGDGGQEDKRALWTSRVAQTASHELGHCFGMAHCVYFACNMMGTAGMEEDFRCPPYFCPVCQVKLGYAVGEGTLDQREYEKRRLEGLRGFCKGNGREKALMWRALGGWVDARLESL